MECSLGVWLLSCVILYFWCPCHYWSVFTGFLGGTATGHCIFSESGFVLHSVGKDLHAYTDSTLLDLVVFQPRCPPNSWLRRKARLRGLGVCESSLFYRENTIEGGGSKRPPEEGGHHMDRWQDTRICHQEEMGIATSRGSRSWVFPNSPQC